MVTYERNQFTEQATKMPIASEGSEGCDGSCHNTDEDVSDGHVADVHVGPRLKARASGSDQ